MNVIIRSQRVTISPALEEHSRERVARALQPFAEQIERVELVFVDLNGPRKSPGQACRVFVAMKSGARVMFETSQRDFYLAASRATVGVGRHIARVVARSRAQKLRPVTSVAQRAASLDDMLVA